MMPVLILIAFISLVVFCGVKTNAKLNTAVKTLPALSCGVYAFLNGGNPYIAAGLFVCAAADAVLNVTFVPGIILFAFAHICLIAGFFFAQAPALWQAALFMLLMCVLTFIIFRGRGRCGNRLPLFIGYAAFLSLMVSAACGAGLAAALAGIIFAVSDSMIGVRILFGIRPRCVDWLCMGTYYSALLLLAFAAVI